MSGISVAAVALQGAPKPELVDGRPSHHANASATKFTNPWPSFRDARWSDWFRAMRQWKSPEVPQNVTELIGLKAPAWSSLKEQPEKLKATWLGHACFLAELPTPPGAARGVRVLFDPVFSHRCAPFQWIGPARITPTPCSIPELPEIDAIVISHCHYDHLDRPTIKSVVFPPSQPASAPPRTHVFAPLNNEHLFRSVSVPSSNYHCLDWWQNRDITVELPSASSTSESGDSKPSTISTTFRLHCTPAQHWGNRHLFDRWTTLWSSWAIESNPVNPSTSQPLNGDMPNKKLWFGGDTGYRSVRDGEDENAVPVCPAFKQIGEKFGEFDLALIPIGAYEPRGALSPMHCAPQDSVCVFKDINAKRALAMHWGTWVLSAEGVLEPVERLKEECAKAGVEDGRFTACALGETTMV